jgi:hypothetical protein
VIALRTLVRVVSFVLLVVLALAGLAVAALAVAPDAIAQAVGLPDLRAAVERWFDGLAGDGPVATTEALVGAGGVLLGLALLAGLLVPRRERLVTLRRTDLGSLDARRRALAAVARSLSEQVRGVTEAKVKVKPRRRGGGRLRVRAMRPRPADARAVDRAINDQLAGLTGPFRLKASVSSRVADRGARVQ